MAKFVGKTFESLNSVLSSSGFFTNLQEKTSSKIIPYIVDSKSFERRLKGAESKQAEDDIVSSYLTAVQKRLSQPDVPNIELSEMIKMCMTCEAYGYSTPFIYVHCLKLAQKGNLAEKHTGYKAASFFLHPNHELVLLLINTIQKDLCSSNYMEVLLALVSICDLINAETVHNIVHLVEEKLKHEKSSVRKTAITSLSHCLNLIDSESAFKMYVPKLEKAMTDSDLEVVAAAVCAMFKVIQKLPCDFSYLIKSLVDLQDQILLRRVPRSMVHCDIPAPFLQLDILRLLNHLCTETEEYEVVTPVLKRTLQQISLHNTLAHATMFQVIVTITCVQPNNELLEMVLSSVSMFLKSKNINLKLTGIEALVMVMKRLKPVITVAQQEIIMECLKLPDETLQIKTLELLFHLANPSNVRAVCKKMMEFIVHSTNLDKRKELTLKVLHLALQFTAQHEWFVSTSLTVLKETGSILPSSNIYSIINTITEDENLKIIAKSLCIDLCRRKDELTPSLVKLISSVLTTVEEFEEFFPFLLKSGDEESISWLLVSLTEIILKHKAVNPNFLEYLKNLFVHLEYSSQVLKQLLFVCENLPCLKEYNFVTEIDPSLTCVDGFVVDALEEGVSYYLPASFRISTILTEETSDAFKTESLSCSELSLAHESGDSVVKSHSYSEFSSPSTSFQSLSCDKELQQVTQTSSSKNVWTAEGRISIQSKDLTLDSKKGPSETPPQDDMTELFAGIS